jgi:hypothetical protein
MSYVKRKIQNLKDTSEFVEDIRPMTSPPSYAIIATTNRPLYKSSYVRNQPYQKSDYRSY